MQIVLASPHESLIAAWRRWCGELEGVAVHEGSIFDVACDAFVSPANSFGFMDGGIDAQYVDRFGAAVQDRVRLQILNRHHGELLIGAAEIVETDDPEHPYLIAAPTMRVPMVLPADTINPFLATRATLLLVREGAFSTGARIAESVHTIAFPGMGTGVGRVSPEICARQMRAAIDLSREPRPSLPDSWAEAAWRHQLLFTDNPTRLQY